MLPSFTVRGGQHDTKYVTFELLMHAEFVADEIWGFMLEPARTRNFLCHNSHIIPSTNAKHYQYAVFCLIANMLFLSFRL